MALPTCTPDDITVDASVTGELIEIENFDGTKEFIPGRYRTPHDPELWCSNCAEKLNTVGRSFDSAVRKHCGLESKKAVA